MNYYKTLGVRPEANPAEIEVAYKALSQSVALSPLELMRVNLAYDTLMSPDKRAEYDLLLQKGFDAAISVEDVTPAETRQQAVTTCIQRISERRTPTLGLRVAQAQRKEGFSKQAPDFDPNYVPHNHPYAFDRPQRSNTEKMLSGAIFGYVMGTMIISTLVTIYLAFLS